MSKATELTHIPMTFAEAKAITAKIAEAVEGVHALLLKAHEGKAWTALGYSSWREYATQEFQYSQRRAYQLLDYARVMVVMDNCTLVQKPSERQARPLTSLPPEQQPIAWAAAVESAGGEQPTGKQVAAEVDKMLAPEQPAPTKQRPANGINVAEQAIVLLKRIKPNDTERVAAGKFLKAWINKNLT